MNTIQRSRAFSPIHFWKSFSTSALLSRRTFLGLPLILCVAIPSWRVIAAEIPVVPPSEAGLSAVKLADVDRFMERAIAEQNIAGGIVAVSHAGKLGYWKAFGQMDLEAKKPMKFDTIFRIYSMSKAITTAAALTLVEAGRIGLDDPVSKYIPSFLNLKVATSSALRPPSRPPTVRDLMLHTAGFSYGSGPDALKEAFGRLNPLGSADLEVRSLTLLANRTRSCKTQIRLPLLEA